MKKLVLASASIIAFSMTGSALAQASVDDRPLAPALPPDTVPPATPECDTAINNCSLVTQDGEALQADVVQTGDDNISDINQINGAFGNGSGPGVDVEQSGNRNTSFVEQDGTGDVGRNQQSTATVVQDGNDAESIIFQRGIRNAQANVTQNGESDSLVIQTGGGLAGDNRVTVDQEGDGNLAVSVQFAGNNDRITTLQTGDDNTAEVYQGDGSNSFRANARVEQVGNGNDAVISQINEPDPDAGPPPLSPPANARNESGARIFQTGDDNRGSIIQRGVRGGQAQNDPNALIDQDGNDNTARVVQTIQSSVTPSIISIDQDNTGNDAFVDQSSEFGTVDIQQISDRTGRNLSGSSRDLGLFIGSETVRANFARATQFGTSSTDLDIVQNGRGNASISLQGNSGGGVSVAAVNQFGRDNTSEINQEADNDIIVDQGDAGTNADGNTSLIRQSGFDNLADVDQFGDDNISEIIQRAGGTNNQAFVDQFGNGDASVITQAGSGNIATVNQGGTP